MTRRRRHARRGGFTLIELILALSITALVGAAIAGMLGAVTSGVMTHRDTRSVMIRASAAQTRFAAYVSPSRKILAASDDEVVLWLTDARKGGTVHASEVRWLSFDEPNGAVVVQYLDFPDAWTQVSQDLADSELRVDADWAAVRDTYDAKGHMTSRRLVDGLASVDVWTNDPDPTKSVMIIWDLGFAVDAGVETVVVSASCHHAESPINP